MQYAEAKFFHCRSPHLYREQACQVGEGVSS